MEIEAKYRLLNPIDPDAVERLDLAPYRLEGHATHALADTLLDTPGRAITRAGWSVRLRRDGPRTFLTLKGPGRVQGAVHRREEHEAELRQPSLDPAAWPAALQARVQALAGGEPLAPLAAVQNQRRTWRVRLGQAEVGELALDEGIISAGGRQEPFRELELELMGQGSEADLPQLEARLRAALPLVPEPRSKLARALALLEDD